MTFTLRLAEEGDLPALRELMALAIDTLQRGFLTPEQIVASRAVMGLDSQLVADRTYFVAEKGAALAGCGGWSRRATMYGGDHSSALRRPEMLDPTHDAARVRAMYTHPGFTRRGVGRLIIGACEDAAASEGFRAVELMGTMSGQPLYLAAGYRAIEVIVDASGGAPVPLVRMRKELPA